MDKRKWDREREKERPGVTSVWKSGQHHNHTHTHTHTHTYTHVTNNQRHTQKDKILQMNFHFINERILWVGCVS